MGLGEWQEKILMFVIMLKIFLKPFYVHEPRTLSLDDTVMSNINFKMSSHDPKEKDEDKQLL